MDEVFKEIVNNFQEGYKAGLKNAIKARKESIRDTAPFPECNGANGCDTCEHQEVQDD